MARKLMNYFTLTMNQKIKFNKRPLWPFLSFQKEENMTILKNAKLRKKMIYAFAAIILVMAIAQAGSMFGLSKNKDQITQMRNISMTSNIASAIEAELLTGQNVFKEFTSTGDTLLIDTFDNHLNNMSQELTNLKTIETNEERIIMIRKMKL